MSPIPTPDATGAWCSTCGTSQESDSWYSGNHDHDAERLHDAGFKSICVAAMYSSNPPLAFSHVPLRRVPPTAINIHGHIHAAEAPSQRHFNVSVERTDYAAVGGTWVLDGAKARGPKRPSQPLR